MGKTKIKLAGVEDTKKEASKKDKKIHLSGLKGGQKIKVIESENIAPIKVEESNIETSSGKNKKKVRTRGKKYLAAVLKFDPKNSYGAKEASKLVKETSYSRFPGSVEMHVGLNIDSINTKINLPYSSGKSKKVEVATEATLDKLSSGKIDFDVLIASPDFMPKLVPFAKILGPKGLMPNPKNGTLSADPQKAKEEFSPTQIQAKNEKGAPLVHLVVGKVNMPSEEIENNIQAVIANIGPKNIKKINVSASMGPAIQVAI